MFRCNANGSGYHITFENGWTVSVQWGPGTYSSNHHDLSYRSNHVAHINRDSLTSPDAEVAAWDANGDWFQFEMENVKGYMTPEEVADFTNMISKQST